MEIIGLIIAGLIVGALARFVNPGRDPMPMWATILLGIGSVLLVGLLLGDGADLGFWGYVLAVIVGAILVTVIGRFWGGRRTATAP
jgi:uncharacterized membrane protein YeaQ/YmgE (transglycosylase-associated protein family)